MDEHPLEHIPLNYDITYISASLKAPNPAKKEFMFTMKQLGYNAVQTYYNAKQWKTDAPPEVLYDLFKVFKTKMYKDEPEKILLNFNKNSAGRRIFAKPLLNPDLDFDYKSAPLEDRPKVV